jgi:hypothetical protein
MPPADKANNDAVDSATAGKSSENDKPSGSKGKAPRGPKGGGKGKDPTVSSKQNDSAGSKTTPGFAEGNAILSGYGLSVSGYRERILTPFKAEKFFHLAEQSYKKLVDIKPTLAHRFSFHEFRHATALQLYHRIESVKFDSLGIKPSAPTRIPLPRNLRVFQPIWSVLANIGTVNDDDLRVQYIPDGILPDSDDLDSEHDIVNLLSCTLYDWKSSWNKVLAARAARKPFAYRDGMDDLQTSNESSLSQQDLIKEVQRLRAQSRNAQNAITVGSARIIDGNLYHYPVIKDASKEDFKFDKTKHLRVNSQVYDISPSEDILRQSKAFYTPEEYDSKIDVLMNQARKVKEKAITPSFDVAYQSESYQVSDGRIDVEAGAYGSRLHWDPQLWLDYENFVNEVASVALFSLSMPAETTGTYAWVLPVEKRQGSENEVFARMPRASIPPATWILALLLQSSTLPEHRRSTFYTETDVLGNVLGLRQRYISAAVKSAAPVEQYGTY